MKRIMLSTWGSAGDLFPLIPVAYELRRRDSEVHFACSRALGLYLRGIGFRSSALGSGEELAALSDPLMFTIVDDGWRSWSRLWDRYVAPQLEHEVAIAHRALEVF